MQLYTHAELPARISFICRASRKFDGEVHKILCSILTHAHRHGDPRQFEPLLDGLASGVRHNAIVAWIVDYSGEQIAIQKNNKTKRWSAAMVPNWDRSEFNLEGAYAVTFGDHTAEPGGKTFTIRDMLKLLEKKATNLELNTDGTYKVSPGVRDAASQLLLVARQNGWYDHKVWDADKAVPAVATVQQMKSGVVQNAEKKRLEAEEKLTAMALELKAAQEALAAKMLVAADAGKVLTVDDAVNNVLADMPVMENKAA
jgi:5'-3' exonuclease